MARYNVIRRMSYSPQALYDIAADVGHYDQFLPLCEAAQVFDEPSQDTMADGQSSFRAELRIAYPKLRLSETFISQVTCNPKRLSVRAVSHEGPVKHIDCRWRFIATNDGGADVEFSLDYELVSRTLNLALAASFDYALRKVMTAFEERARILDAAKGLTSSHVG